MLVVMLATCVIRQFHSTHIPAETIEMTLVNEGRCPLICDLRTKSFQHFLPVTINTQIYIEFVY